jgi:hypothetical protein
MSGNKKHLAAASSQASMDHVGSIQLAIGEMTLAATVTAVVMSPGCNVWSMRSYRGKHNNCHISIYTIAKIQLDIKCLQGFGRNRIQHPG